MLATPGDAQQYVDQNSIRDPVCKSLQTTVLLPPQRHPPLVSNIVKDDWDDDEDELEAEEDPQKLWEEANKRAPMPELLMSGSSTSVSAAVPPPATAFQPVLRILKRPTAISSHSTSHLPSASPDAQSNSYADREARYNAARERIFGDPSPTPGSPDPSNRKVGAKNSPPSIQIARAPKGPPAPFGVTSPTDQNPGGDPRGFGSRRGKRRGAEGNKP